MADLPNPDRFAIREDFFQLHAGFAELEANVRGEIKAGNSELLRTLFFAMLATNATLVGFVFAAVRLA